MGLELWHDNWCRDRLLKDAYPEFYSIARDRDALVADYFERMDAGSH